METGAPDGDFPGMRDSPEDIQMMQRVCQEGEEELPREQCAPATPSWCIVLEASWPDESNLQGAQIIKKL